MSEPHFRRGRLVGTLGAAAMLLAGVAFGLLAGWALSAWYSQPTAALEGSQLARRAALAHAIYAPEVRHPVEVAAGENAHLAAWLSKRLEADVRAPDLGGAGFALLGGRLLPGEAPSGAESLPAAQFMYENANGQRVTLYVRNTSRLHGDSEPRYARIGNVAVFQWAEGPLEYAIASADLGRNELRLLRQAARQRDRGFVRR